MARIIVEGLVQQWRDAAVLMMSIYEECDALLMGIVMRFEDRS